MPGGGGVPEEVLDNTVLLLWMCRVEKMSPKKYLDKHSDIAVDVQGGGGVPGEVL